jgi:hypothetical protein
MIQIVGPLLTSAVSADDHGLKTSPGFGASLAVPRELLRRIDKLKIIPREPRWLVLQRLMDEHDVRSGLSPPEGRTRDVPA